jgi:hypothetical protein
MKNYLVLFLLALSTTFAVAQNNYQDVVYLKNGSIIRGVIVEQVPNQSIKIELADKSIFVYQFTEIEKLTKELSPGRTAYSDGPELGYSFNIEVGHQFNVDTSILNAVSLNIIDGFQVSPYVFVGAGVGVRYFYDDFISDANGKAAFLIPVFADVKVNFINNATSPYFSLGLGYTFDPSYAFVGVGVFINPTIGVSFLNMNVGISYENQKIKGTGVGANSLGIKVGFIF